MGQFDDNPGVVSNFIIPDSRDIEADIVIIGCGMAGTGAALKALDRGSSIVVPEKAGEAHSGGDSRTNGGGCFAHWRTHLSW